MSKEKQSLAVDTLEETERDVQKQVSIVTPQASAQATDETLTAASSENETDDWAEISALPLLKYTTLTGVAPRKLASGNDSRRLERPCTCTAVAQVLMYPADPTTAALTFLESTTSTTPASVDEDDEAVNMSALLSSDLWKQPHMVMAMGWETGTVSLASVKNNIQVKLEQSPGSSNDSMSNITTATNSGVGGSATSSSSNMHSSLTIREGGGSESAPPPPTVDVSMDSTGTLLAAIDQGGTCCIWELKYTPSLQHQQQQVVDVMADQGDVTSTPPAVTAAAAPSSTTSTTTSTPAVSSNKGSSSGGGGMFSSFMTKLTGLPPTPEAEVQTQSTTTAPTSSTPAPTPSTTTTRMITVPCLAASITSTSRITYPSHWKPPTCLVVDPRKAGKSLVVGFQDGRLLWTKRYGGGLLFQRRNDTVLYQGGATGAGPTSSTTTEGGLSDYHQATATSSNYAGIECVAWRGNMVAWADASGIKLLDIETLTRIAHIDRPTGARAALYPSLRLGLLRPHLVFETSSNLLVAWGDCLMNMELKESPTPGDGTSIAMRRTVQCTMAWELDCVAMGVAPLNGEHVVILGAIPPNEEEEEEGEEEEDAANEDGKHSAPPAAAVPASPRHDHRNELEVQIVSRTDGTIQYADILPQEVDVPTWLESSFALPRMENSSEWNEFKAWSGRLDDTFDLNLLTGGSGGTGSMDAGVPPPAPPAEPTTPERVHSHETPAVAGSNQIVAPISSNTGGGSPGRPRNKFVDSHLQWNLKSITFADELEQKMDDDSDQDSVDSDDYGFVLRPLELLDDIADSLDVMATPPIMVIASTFDLVAATLCNVDDAVEHALVTQNRPALALKRALQHRRQLRRYKVSDLVQHYLEALLCLSPDGAGVETSSLSLRRMKLAIQAMPVLLGGRLDQWTKWAQELEKLPGALFLLQSHLPVRDPVLPPALYEQVLRGMLKEYEGLAREGESNRTVALDKEAAHHVLESLLAWGPTRGLKEYIKIFQSSRRKGDKSVVEALRRAEVALQRRYLQTASGYLNFPISQVSPDEQIPSNTLPRYDAHNDDSQDTLFQLENVMKWVAPRTPLVARKLELAGEAAESQSQLVPNDRVFLEAMARLRMMQCRFDLALQAYLAIGACHSPVSMVELESRAKSVFQGGTSKAEQPIQIEDTNYEYVLGLVENHHLHRLLLDKDFIVKNEGGEKTKFGPLFALLRLVGLSRAGDFLMQHCVAPELHADAGPGLYDSSDDSKESQRSETLPMDLVVAQLESSPPLMYWYLNLVFTKKAELYIKFPNNSIPPDAVIELHRKHFQLHLDFAGDAKDSAKVLSGIETYKVEATTTPLLSFLKAALPLGGISPIDARRQLEILRSEEASGSDEDVDEAEGSAMSQSFALELAHVIEHYSEETEVEAETILDLLLEGAKSIMLGVAYAQRQREYSALLWDKLIRHCLPSSDGRTGDGMLFGTLLEAAALSGADLARLVSKIPPGMVVEGLRPRLVAAVADYRLKVDIHQAATAAASEEQVTLIREVAHRSRRGARFVFPRVEESRARQIAGSPSESKFDESALDQPAILPRNLRPIERRQYHTLALSLPLR